MVPDIVINIRFLTPSEGGRTTSLAENFLPYYAAPMLIDGQYFDCRIILNGKGFDLGKHYEFPVAFLHRATAMKEISIGKEISLWEGKIIAKAKITGIMDNRTR